MYSEGKELFFAFETGLVGLFMSDNNLLTSCLKKVSPVFEIRGNNHCGGEIFEH